MNTNESKEHIRLLNVRLMHSIDTLVGAYKEGYEFFKEKKPDGGDDDYYAAVLSSFADGVLRTLKRGGETGVATSEPVMVAVALVKYLSKHPEFKSNLMF